MSFYGYDPKDYIPNYDFIGEAVEGIGSAISMMPEIKRLNEERKTNDGLSNELYEDMYSTTERFSKDKTITGAFGKAHDLFTPDGEWSENGIKYLMDNNVVDPEQYTATSLHDYATQNKQELIGGIFMDSATGAYLSKPNTQREDGSHVLTNVDQYVNEVAEKTLAFYSAFTGDYRDIDYNGLVTMSSMSDVGEGVYGITTKKLGEERNRRGIEHGVGMMKKPAKQGEITLSSGTLPTMSFMSASDAASKTKTSDFIKSDEYVAQDAANKKKMDTFFKKYFSQYQAAKVYDVLGLPSVTKIGEMKTTDFAALVSPEVQKAFFSTLDADAETYAAALGIELSNEQKSYMRASAEKDIANYVETVKTLSNLSKEDHEAQSWEIDLIRKYQGAAQTQYDNAQKMYNDGLERTLSGLEKGTKEYDTALKNYKDNVGGHYKTQMAGASAILKETATIMQKSGYSAFAEFSNTDKEAIQENAADRVAGAAQQLGNVAKTVKDENSKDISEETLVATGTQIKKDQTGTKGDLQAMGFDQPERREALKDGQKKAYDRYSASKKSAGEEPLPFGEFLLSDDYKQMRESDPNLAQGMIVETDADQASDDLKVKTKQETIEAGKTALAEDYRSQDPDVQKTFEDFFTTSFGKKYAKKDKEAYKRFMSGETNALPPKKVAEIQTQYARYKEDLATKAADKGRKRTGAEKYLETPVEERSLVLADRLKDVSYDDAVALADKYMKSSDATQQAIGADLSKMLLGVGKNRRDIWQAVVKGEPQKKKRAAGSYLGL